MRENHFQQKNYKNYLYSGFLGILFRWQHKTLSPKIYGSILHVRDNKKHINEFSKLNFPEIDIVIINLYPFEKFSKDNENKAIEMIDIGGTSLLRASSKNYKYVTPIADIKDYKKLIKSLNENSG